MESSKYNTNLAAKFYVLSMLYRKGINAYLTLGNKKAVDILIDKNKGKSITIDVKGLSGKTSWPLDNFKKKTKGHFIVLVSFLGKFSDHSVAPECWIVPSKKVEKLFYINPKRTRQVVNRYSMIKNGLKYKNNWKLLG